MHSQNIIVSNTYARARARVCVCVCMRACVRACVRACNNKKRNVSFYILSNKINLKFASMSTDNIMSINEEYINEYTFLE